MSHISELFESRRKELDLSVRQVAKKAGYTPKNLSKGMRKYSRLEESDCYFPRRTIRDKFAPVLGLTGEDIREALHADIEELDQPVDPYIIIRWMPAVYGSVDLPDGCSREEAERRTREVAREKDKRCCLVLSRIRGLYVEPDGSSVEAYSLPNTSLGGSVKSGITPGTDPHLQRAVARYFDLEKAEGEEVHASGRPTVSDRA